jgi:ABC-2 type transport system permease protein
MWRDSLKVARWEALKMLKNPSFLVSILLTPVIMIAFGGIPALLERIDAEQPFRLFVVDKLGVYDTLKEMSPPDPNLELVRYEGDIATLAEEIRGESTQGFVVLDQAALATRTATITLGGDGTPPLHGFSLLLSSVLRFHALQAHGVSTEVINLALAPFHVETTSLTQRPDPYARMIPLVFGALILMTIFITGMMTLQSAVTEKKDRMAEVLLSSVTPDNLMQGKILGNCALGIVQVAAWLIFGIAAAHFFYDIPVLRYLATPNLPLIIFFALGGYVLSASVLVAIGATIEDMATATNFQSMVFLLPMFPVLFIGPVIANPNGLVAAIGSYFPFAAPGVMVMRLALSTTLTAVDILLPALVMLVLAALMMKLAGKVFRVAMLMYGKNPTPMEMWRWIRQ